jgi:hypothetical protein
VEVSAKDEARGDRDGDGMRRWVLKLADWKSAGCVFWPLGGLVCYVTCFLGCAALAFRIVPRVGSLFGEEFFAFAIVGCLGGGLVPLTANIARLLLTEDTIERRWGAAIIGAVGGAFNGFWLSLFVMVPALALMHSCDPKSPYLGDADVHNRYVVWRDAGAWTGAALGAVLATWLVQAYSPQQKGGAEDLA